MSAQPKPQTVFDRLREPVPDNLIATRQQSGTKIRYIEWHTAADLLDEIAPGWTCEIKEVGNVAGKVFIRVALTIEGVTRENIGFEEEAKSGYGDPFSNSFSMALKRAAALFGLGRHLYDKDDHQQQPQRPQQQANGDGATANQIGAIKAICLKKHVNVAVYGDLSKLTFKKASQIINELNGYADQE